MHELVRTETHAPGSVEPNQGAAPAAAVMHYKFEKLRAREQLHV
jgi:hypothetical protein